MDPFYATLRLLVRFWFWFFFKSVEVRHAERIPRQGPVLLCINHPNNLIDSLLVGVAVPRKVHFLATAALFRNPLLARFLAAAGVIPIYRRQDDPDKMERNVAAFEACFSALRQGRLIAIYPEGTTHAEPRVQRIKTGAARLALEAEAPEQGALGLAVIPVGLNFEARKSFRGRVLVNVGEPIPLAPYLKYYRDDPWKAVDTLTTEIQQAMEAQVIHVDRIDLAELVRAVGALYRDNLVRELQEERGLAPEQVDVFRLSRAIVAAVHHFATHDPERVERVWHRIQTYNARLAQYRIKDQAVRGRLEPTRRRLPLARSGLGVLGLPIFVYGLLVNGVPYFVPRMLARNLTRKETDYATARLLSSIVLLPLCWGLETWVVWRLTGLLVAALFFVSLPLSGLVAYRYLGGLGSLRAKLGFAMLATTRSHAATRLLLERRQILEELEQARRDYLAAAKGSSF